MRTILSSVTLALALCAARPAAAEALRPVIIAPVGTAHFTDRVEALGTLRANEAVDVTAIVSDIVTAVYFDDGQRVAQGDVLVTVASGEQRALLEEARAAAKEAAQQYERARRLVDQGTVSRAVLDERRRLSETAEARRRAVQQRLNDRIVTAPFAGVVGLRKISAGALVSPGTVLARLIDDSVMKLDFSVPATFLDTMRTGLAITATARGLDGATFEGTITGIENEIDPVTRSITARAILPNPDRRLVPGLLMSVTLHRNPRTAPAVPEEALVHLGRDTYVFVTQPGDAPTVERRLITPGLRRAGEVEVIEGVAPGEHVVSHGADRLRPGQAVSIRAVDDGSQPIEALLRNLPAG